jgi:beta-lactamase class A
MMTASDNTGTNMLVEWVGGLDVVNSWLESKGFKSTRMLATIGSRKIWNKELREIWGLGMTTPNEMRNLAELIVTGKAGSTTATDEMLRILGHQYFDGGIASQVPPTVWVGSKSGSVNRSRSDVAIVGSPSGIYILSVYTKDNINTAWDSSNEAEKRIRNVSRLVWKHFNPKVPFEQPKGAEKL